MLLTKLFTDFFRSEKFSGLVLLFCTTLSMVLANTTPAWNDMFMQQVGGHSVTHWINDGLMAIFFLLIGLELERELYNGELRSVRRAGLPAIAALGGMVVPALIFLCINSGNSTTAGAGIPMATDIAFALGILSLLGNRVPAALKVLLTAIAVIDDLGAILVIAVFYTSELSLPDLGIAFSIFALLIVFNRLKVRNLLPYLAGGVAMWYFMLHSGVHATITGVLVAFAIPFGDGGPKSTSYVLQDWLHKPVAFIILPLFALANTCIPISPDSFDVLSEPLGIGIITGLVLGKPLGVFLFSFFAVKARITFLPDRVNWKMVAGAGMLGGIGFTMSIFISLLAFSNDEFQQGSKLAVLTASLIAGVTGFLWLKTVMRKKPQQQHVD